MAELKDLDFPEVRGALKAFVKMPDVKQCGAVAATITDQTSLMPGADIMDGTARQRASGLVTAIEGYHGSLRLLQRELHETSAAIQAYAARPSRDTLERAALKRLDMELHLNDLHQDCQDVGRALSRFKQIQGAETLPLTQRMTDVIAVIEPRLAEQAQRIADRPELDIDGFHAGFMQRTLVNRALAPRTRRPGLPNPADNGPSPLQNELAVRRGSLVIVQPKPRRTR